MITGSIKTQVDNIWNAFWSGGISNPMEVIEQMTYLLFIKRLDELQTVKEKKANRTKQPVEDPIFNSRQQKLRWSKFKSLGDPAAMYTLVADEVFPFIKTLGGDKGDSTYAAHMKDARFTIPTPALLAKVVDMLDAIPWTTATPRATFTSTCSARSPVPDRTGSSAPRATSSS